MCSTEVLCTDTSAARLAVLALNRCSWRSAERDLHSAVIPCLFSVAALCIHLPQLQRLKAPAGPAGSPQHKVQCIRTLNPAAVLGLTVLNVDCISKTLPSAPKLSYASTAPYGQSTQHDTGYAYGLGSLQLPKCYLS